MNELNQHARNDQIVAQFEGIANSIRDLTKEIKSQLTTINNTLKVGLNIGDY